MVEIVRAGYTLAYYEDIFHHGINVILSFAVDDLLRNKRIFHELF